MNETTLTYQEMTLSSRELIVPSSSYQRPFRPEHAMAITNKFDEHLANEPKVSYRGGNYYVFDGQHTIAARKNLNGGNDVLVKCKVYYDLTEEDEALLFAQQFGESSALTAGIRMRALVFGKDPEALAFVRATEDAGIHLDFDQKRGRNRMGCIYTAFREFQCVGAEVYTEALEIVREAWDGEPQSMRGEIVQSVIKFVSIYHDEYNRRRLVRRLSSYDPLTIYREGQAMGVNMPGHKKYLFQVFRIYNGGSRKTSLPMKF